MYADIVLHDFPSIYRTSNTFDVINNTAVISIPPLVLGPR